MLSFVFSAKIMKKSLFVLMYLNVFFPVLLLVNNIFLTFLRVAKYHKILSGLCTIAEDDNILRKVLWRSISSLSLVSTSTQYILQASYCYSFLVHRWTFYLVCAI